MHTPGERRMRSLADMNYVQTSVLDGLHAAGERKAADELDRLRQRGVHADENAAQMQVVIGGGHVMQVIHRTSVHHMRVHSTVHSQLVEVVA
jgi:hypothetical protein